MNRRRFSRSCGPALAVSMALATLRQLLLLPDHDKLVAFDRHLQELASMGDSMAVAKPARRQEFMGMLVEQMVTSGRQVREVIWTPAARPFFGADRAICRTARVTSMVRMQQGARCAFGRGRDRGVGNDHEPQQPALLGRGEATTGTLE